MQLDDVNRSSNKKLFLKQHRKVQLAISNRILSHPIIKVHTSEIDFLFLTKHKRKSLEKTYSDFMLEATVVLEKDRFCIYSPFLVDL